MRIAIFGGAFDPPHNGHVSTISKLINSQRFDRIVVVPSGDRPDKPGSTPAAERVQMAKLAINDAFPESEQVVLLSDQALGKIGYGTIDVIRALMERYPGDELFVVIGEELVDDLPQWKDSTELSKVARFVILARPGSLGSRSANQDGIFSVEALNVQPEVGVLLSSSYLRQAIRDGVTVAGLLPSVVSGYIALRNLYR